MPPGLSADFGAVGLLPQEGLLGVLGPGEKEEKNGPQARAGQCHLEHELEGPLIL